MKILTNLLLSKKFFIFNDHNNLIKKCNRLFSKIYNVTLEIKKIFILNVKNRFIYVIVAISDIRV